MVSVRWIRHDTEKDFVIVLAPDGKEKELTDAMMRYTHYFWSEYCNKHFAEESLRSILKASGVPDCIIICLDETNETFGDWKYKGIIELLDVHRSLFSASNIIVS